MELKGFPDDIFEDIPMHVIHRHRLVSSMHREAITIKRKKEVATALELYMIFIIITLLLSLIFG